MFAKFSPVSLSLLACGAWSFAGVATALAEEQKQLPTIHITADPLAPSLLESGSPVSVMGQTEIAIETQSTLGEVVGKQPGVSTSFFGQGASRPVIRGFAGERVRVMRNGMATQDASNLSEDHVVTADPLEAEAIEVLRGPETLLFGSSAIGGAVNVIDSSIPESKPEKPFSGSLQGNLGNATTEEQSAAARLLGSVGELNLSVSAFYRDLDDYSIPGSAESSRLRAFESMGVEGGGESHEHDHDELAHDEQEDEHEHEHSESDHEHEGEEEEESRGRVRNTAVETKGFTVGASHVWNKGFFGAAVSYFDSEYGIPGHSHGHEHEHEVHEEDEEHEGEHAHSEEEEEGEENVSIDARQLRADLRGRVDEPLKGVEAIKFRSTVTSYEHDEVEGGEVATTYENDAVEGRVEFLHTLFSDRTGVVGTQLSFNDFSAEGDEAFIGPTKTINPALFVFEPISISEALRFEVGARTEFVGHDPDGLSSESFVPVSLSAGPVWDVFADESYTVGLTFSYTERAPAPIELFSDGVHVARQIYERGDSNLDKEAAWGADLSLRKNTGVVTASLTPFVQRFTNYLNLTGTGEEIEEFPVFAYEEVDALFWGFEAETTLYLGEMIGLLHHALNLDLQLDWVRARDTSNDQNLPRIPPFRGITRASYEYREWVGGSIEGVFVDAQTKVAEGEIPTSSYAMLNAEVHMHLKHASERSLLVFLRGANLNDQEARVHSSFLKDLAPLPGRSILLGVRGTF